MNAKQWIAAAVVLTAANVALAQQADNAPSPAGKTRAQVLQELTQARADGSAATYGFLGSPKPVVAAGDGPSRQAAEDIAKAEEKTRAQVRAERNLAELNRKGSHGQAAE